MNEGERVPYVASHLPVAAQRGVLVLAPHPDDEVFGCGGAAALYAAAGTPVHALILTDGGLWGRPPPGRGVVETRQDEARAAAEVLGCGAPVFGPFADRQLGNEPGLAAYIAQQARACGADVLLAPSPWEVHPDHVATAMAAIDAIAQLGDGHVLAQYEVGMPMLAHVLVDITPVLARKRQAMACFVSQLAMQRYDRHVDAMNIQRSYTLAESVEAAEAFRVATPREAQDDPFGLVYQGRPHPVCDFIPRLRTQA